MEALSLPLQPPPEGEGPSMMRMVEEAEQDQEQEHRQMMEMGMGMEMGMDMGLGMVSRAPKRRAETWVQEEIHIMLACRKELDAHFHTCKSNKHLWEQISQRMKERGFDRSPTMCKDKWRNLLKDYRKLGNSSGRSATAHNNKVGYFKDIEDVIGADHLRHHKQQLSYPQQQQQMCDNKAKFNQIVPKDDEAANSTLLMSEFDRSAMNLDQRMDNDSQATSLLSHDSPLENGMSPWNWRDNNANGLPQWNVGIEHSQPAGRVILVKCGDITRKIGIDGSPDAIKDTIKSVFGLRSKRAFWLEDEDGVIRSLDRDMPPRTYNLFVDPGLTVKLCYFDGREPEEKTLYCEEDFHELLRRRGWHTLREVGGYKDIDTMEELQPMHAYQEGGFKEIGV